MKRYLLFISLSVLAFVGCTHSQPEPTSIALSTATVSEYGVGSTLIADKDGMTLVYVPAGEFNMGSDHGQSDEIPVHQVYLKAFWIDKTEVTNAMFAHCVKAGGCNSLNETLSSTRNFYYGSIVYENYPVIFVSWEDARAYCAWAGRRLPTEAEWEKAARGADGRMYPWGNESPNNRLLNYNAEVGDTTAVGAYPAGASPYGALDMAGNVWEWVQDWYGETYYRNSPSSNPQGPDSGTYRVQWGGSWVIDEHYIRSTARYWAVPLSGYNYVGFRCAMSATS